jgi:hypothetical protein
MRTMALIRFGPITIREEHGPKSITNRHGMPCRTVPERRPYSRAKEKAQQAGTSSTQRERHCPASD